jgi:hypothetical protein
LSFLRADTCGIIRSTEDALGKAKSDLRGASSGFSESGRASDSE